MIARRATPAPAGDRRRPLAAPLAGLCGLAALAAALIPTSAAAAACGAPATRLHEIQGTGRSSPLLGATVEVEAVVVAVFPDFPHGLGGFFLQEEDVDTDADPDSSEGLFVFDGGLGTGLAPRDGVRVRGRVSEFFGLTELALVTDVRRCRPRGPASAAPVALPLSAATAWERWEGMRVRIDQTLVATGHHDLGRYGEVELAAGGRLWQPTHRALPGADALAHADANARRRILLDDGSDAVEPVPTPYLDLADAGGRTLRLGDAIAGLEGVLDFAFGRFRIHPTTPVHFQARGPRPQRPPPVDGTLRVAVWNVENHFNGDGRGGGFPTRGARSPAELTRQREKLVETLVRLDADVVALVELENDGVGPESALGQLARASSLRSPHAPYVAIDPGRPRLGAHAIAVGLLHRPSTTSALGPPAVLDRAAHPDFDDARNRPSLAQTFRAQATGEVFTVVVSHLKSKGSPCDAAGDPDVGDGQGACAGTRRRAALALVEWLAGDPTGAGDAPALVAGDLNAYPREDALRAFEDAGWVDVVAHHAGPDAWTYVFDGAAGRLDHALVRGEWRRWVGGAGVWHVNADEPRLHGYRTAAPADAPPGPFRASDHDPLLVGLFPDADADGVTDARDACPHTVLAPTLRLADCDTRAPESIDDAGCNRADRLRRLRDAWPQRASRLRATRRWLAERIDEGRFSRRHRGRVLACMARWQ